MLYKVVQDFGPNHRDWKQFAEHHWIQPLLSFDSVDGILAPDLVHPSSAEDWSHCVTEDFRTSLITDLVFARKVQQKFPDSRIVGVQENCNCDGFAVVNQDENRHGPRFLGYDILDEHNHVSLITNWGPHDAAHPLARFAIQSNGLMPGYKMASAAAAFLREKYSGADHASGATVWAIFSIGKE
jgi:hypothetical protein